MDGWKEGRGDGVGRQVRSGCDYYGALSSIGMYGVVFDGTSKRVTNDGSRIYRV